MSNIHTDFILPGHRHDHEAIPSACMITAAAFSNRVNRRRLEDRFHPKWADIYSALVHDLRPQVYPVAQYSVYMDSEPVHGRDVSSGTIPDGYASKYIPDFLIMHTHCANYIKEQIQLKEMTDWGKLKITTFKPLMLAELKTCPPRNIATQKDFLDHLRFHFHDATTEAEEKVTFLFANEDYKYGTYTG